MESLSSDRPSMLAMFRYGRKTLDPRLTFLSDAWKGARQAQHIWPDYAACEAALESAYGTTELARFDNNLFGMKQHFHHLYGDHILPTKEFLGGEWVVVRADFIKYPGWRECFLDRMTTLLRLAGQFPHYSAALHAKDGETFVTEVSRSWSTDPARGAKVLAIYRERMSLVIAANAQPVGVTVPEPDGA